ncbi:hypothetical protein H6800_02545 [Candidatus Nomurabacteria bacterium]|nr:hypothetical protein [Candidatus Nomurabacteria bacterium]
MVKLNNKGLINPLLIPLVLSALVMVGFAISTYVYYTNFVDQRDNVNQKISNAVEIAETEQREKLDKDFAEREKIPNKTYTSPSIYGSVKLTFPKTWSSFVTDTGSSIDYYGHPDYVPSKGVNYALRMNVSTKKFASEIKSYDAEVKKGDLKAVSITVSGTTGTRLDGLLKKDQQGTMVIFPLRDKTLKVWTENKDFAADFESVLKQLTFVP